MNSAEGHGWQDIASAPKDGSSVLTFGCLHNDNGVDMGETPSIQLSRYMDDMGWYSDSWGGHEPTHWRPLPAPPVSASKPETGE